MYKTEWVQTKDSYVVKDNIKNAIAVTDTVLTYMLDQLKTHIPANVNYQTIGEGNSGLLGTVTIVKQIKIEEIITDENGYEKTVVHEATERFKLVGKYENNTLTIEERDDAVIIEAILMALSWLVPEIVLDVSKEIGLLDPTIMKPVLTDDYFKNCVIKKEVL